MKKDLKTQVYLKGSEKEWVSFFDLDQEEQGKNAEKWRMANTEILLDYLAWERIKDRK